MAIDEHHGIICAENGVTAAEKTAEKKHFGHQKNPHSEFGRIVLLFRRIEMAAAEAFQRLRVLGHVIGQELERNETAEFGVLGLVNYAHTTAADSFDDAIARNGLANHEVV